ncbi:MAG: extensin family protein [Pseudomonadota bacterium]
MGLSGKKQRLRVFAVGAGLTGVLLISVSHMPAFGQSFGPFKNPFRTLGLTPPDAQTKRKAAPSRPAIPTLPLRKPAPPPTPAEVTEAPAADPVPADTAKALPEPPTPPSEPAAAPAQALTPTADVASTLPKSPADTTVSPQVHDAASVVAAQSTDGPAPHPVRNPVRDGSDATAAKNPKVVAALEQCVKLLDGLALAYEHLDPIRRGPCGTPAPIKLKSIGKYPKIVVSPPATVNCTVAATLHKWFTTSVQPTAEALGTSVVKIKNAASYMCRNQYGRSDTKLSEHALANALDIKAFVLASGQTIPILGNWPYGYRPTRPRVAEAPWPNPLRDHSTLPPPTYRTPGLSVLNKELDYQEFTKEADEFGEMATHPFFKPVFAAPAQIPDPADQEPEGPVPEGNLSRAEAKSFLKTIHGDACKMFWTVLGPESNAAHRDHFHFDMRKRRYVRICQ